MPWARIANGTGSGDGRVMLAFDTTDLKEGRYEGTVRIVSGDEQSVLLPVTLTMLPTPVVAPVGGFLSFHHINGAPVDAVRAQFELESAVPVSWTLVSDSPWAMASPATGTTPDRARVAIDPARGALASGRHEARLTISSPYGKDFNMLVTLNLSAPTLSASVPTLTLGGQHGRDFSPQPVTLSLYTGSNAWPWTLAGLPAWARASAGSGSVNQAGTTLTLTPDETRAAVGSTTVMLNAQVRVNGDTITRGIPLTINRDQRKILPSAVGVALVSTPGWSRLSRSVTVSDNFNGGAAWSAASDRGWLGVQRNGATLTLSADPAALPSNATSYATVTLTPADPSIAAPEKIRVGLWKGSANPAPMVKLDSAYTKVAADPVRPLAYVHDGGAAIDVFNVYTGQKTGSIAMDAPLGEMAVSPDGTRLYAFWKGKAGVAVVDLATLTPAAPLAVAGGGEFSRILPIRPNGVDVLVTMFGNYRVADGVRLSNLPMHGLQYEREMAASQDGKRVYVSTHDLASLAVDYSQTGDGSLFAARVDDPIRPDAPSGRTDIAANADGSRLYTTGGPGSSAGCTDFDAGLKLLDTLPSGLESANNVEVDSFGRIVCGATGYYRPADIWVMSPGGALLRSYRFVESSPYGLRTQQVVASGDGMMLVALAEKPGMTIIAVGP